MKTIKNRKHLVFFILFSALPCMFFHAVFSSTIFTTSLLEMTQDLWILAFFTFLIASILGWFIITGMPKGCISMYLAMKRIGFFNTAEQPPILVSRSPDKNNPQIQILEFESCGIPVSDWVNAKERLEASLNMIITEVDIGRNNHYVVLHAVPVSSPWPQKIPWDDSFTSHMPAGIILGKSYSGDVTWDPSVIPHAIIAGSSGSGKSLLCKLIIYQALSKNFDIFIVDFKKGVDFNSFWRRTCNMCFDEKTTLHILTGIVELLEFRRDILAFNNCANIDEYNHTRCPEMQFSRVLIVFDEIAELLDKTGRTKEDKELISQIESKIATIARQGRAMGCHLLLSTQRPDANILPGQIKNNVDFRVCGRADSVLSQIVLDSTVAADQIPKSAQGRFILADGTVFQAYWLDEKEL